MLSVIIPCYNNGNYLKEMLNCFKYQTSSAWEMIIVDDGSTDDTPQVINNVINNMSQVHYIKRDRIPKGSVVCRNIGFEHAKGKYICHLDADDLVSDTFVEQRLAFMEANPDVDYASFPTKSFSDKNNLPTFNNPGYTWGIKRDNCDLLKEMLKGYDYPFSVWNNIYKHSAVEKYRWDEKVLIYTDFSYIVPCILGGLRHRFSESINVDYYYRNVPNNKNVMTSNFVSREKCESTIYLFDKTLNSFNAHGIDKKYKKYFFVFFLTHFSRLVLGKCEPELIVSFTQFAAKHYRCRMRLSLVGNISIINSVPLRHFMLSITYAVFFGKFRLLNTYLISIKKRLLPSQE